MSEVSNIEISKVWEMGQMNDWKVILFFEPMRYKYSVYQLDYPINNKWFKFEGLLENE